MKPLLGKTFGRFALCCLLLLMVSAPLFYLLTKHFYAEDMVDIVTAVEQGRSIPPLDLERDIMAGMMLQFVLIFCVVSVALFITMRFVAGQIWRPFEETLRKAEDFDVAHDGIPHFHDAGIAEFHRLNRSLERMMRRSREIYREQKEFTENASHELQTPLAVTRSSLDLLMQENLSSSQMQIVEGLYRLNAKMERLNRNLLLLAKLDNSQCGKLDDICLPAFIAALVPSYRLLKSGCGVRLTDMSGGKAAAKANASLLECLLNNLVVNAVRNTASGDVEIIIAAEGKISIGNPSDGSPLDSATLFRRFRSGAGNNSGTGLGLAIAKAICGFHGWEIGYSHGEGRHLFSVCTHPSASRVDC